MEHVTAYSIPVKDLTDGQVIRDYRGLRAYVVRDLTVGSAVTTYDLVGMGSSVVKHATASPTAGHIPTWLPSWLVDQPGLDGESMRCLTCDSRHCGNVCREPWLMDRA